MPNFFPTLNALYYKHIENTGDYCAVDSEDGLRLYVQFPGKRFWCVWDRRDFLMQYRPTTAERIVKEQSARFSMKQNAIWQTQFWANQQKQFGPRNL